MNQSKNKICIAAGLTAIFWMVSGLFALSFAADTSSGLTGTDSAGSYSYDADKKSEGSKSKAPAAASPHGKAEGSKAKGYSHHGKGYSHHGKSYSHKKPEGSGAKKGHSSKGHGHKFGKKEGSGGKSSGGHGGKSYGHGKSHHGKSYGGHGGKKYSHGKKGHGGHSKKSPFAHVLKFKDKLALTADQVGKIKAKEFEYKKTSIEIRAAHEIAHLQLDRIVHSGQLDEARMREIADEMSAVKSKKIHMMVEAKIFLLKVLTPEQRQKISQVHGAH
jgi:Spy/CpxP family protein refolding chaperone